MSIPGRSPKCGLEYPVMKSPLRRGKRAPLIVYGRERNRKGTVVYPRSKNKRSNRPTPRPRMVERPPKTHRRDKRRRTVCLYLLLVLPVHWLCSSVGLGLGSFFGVVYTIQAYNNPSKDVRRSSPGPTQCNPAFPEDFFTCSSLCVDTNSLLGGVVSHLIVLADSTVHTT